MKKFIPYCVLSGMALTVAIYAYIIIGFDLLSWQSLLALLFILSPLWILGWKQLALIGRKRPFASLLGRLGMINLTVIYVVIIVLMCVGVLKW